VKKILIIDDDKLVGKIYLTRFTYSGFDVKVAHSGKEALSVAREFKPNIIQTDLTLPDISGIEVIRAIRAIRATPEIADVPIIVLTNGYITELVQEAWKCGATEVQTKAECTPRAMVEIVERILAKTITKVPPAPNESSQKRLPPALAEDTGDALFELEIGKAFQEQIPKECASLMSLHRSLMTSYGQASQEVALCDLRRKMRNIAGSAGIVGKQSFAKLASALEALVQSMQEREEAITLSSKRTMAQGIDKLVEHLQGRKNLVVQGTPQILVVDDDIISRKVAIFALKKVGLPAISVATPTAALELLENQAFDLVLMDIDMPEMSGFDLQRKVKNLPMQKETPVIYVTALDDFATRAKSTLSGGSDLIGKPFPPLELGIKALILTQ
jgi:CheY-like chemotaxis protein